MAEYQRSNNNTQRSTNTSGSSLKNGKAEIPTALSVTYWDDRVKLAFALELPEAQQTQMRRYDYDHSIVTTISRDKCNELYNAYKQILRPAIITGEQKSISVPIAGVNQLQINTNVKDGVPHPYIALIKNIDENSLTATPENIVKYEFCMGEYVEDYNPVDGSFSNRVITYNELDLFMNDLKVFREAGSNAYVHTDRVVNRYWKDTLDSKINRIGEKNGLDLSYKPKYGTGGNGGTGSIFDKPTGTPPEGQATVGSIDELDNIMMGM